MTEIENRNEEKPQQQQPPKSGIFINKAKIDLTEVVNKPEEESEDEENKQDTNRPQTEQKTEPVTEAENEERRLRMVVISRYRLSNRFGEYLKQQGFNLAIEHLQTLSVPQLDKLINDVRFYVSTKNTGSYIQSMAVGGA